MSNAPSWGRLDAKRRPSHPLDQNHLRNVPGSILAYGNGRSYGDSCHNDQGTLITTRQSSAIISFDKERGILTAQAGILLGDILHQLHDSNWFLPVVPGTRFVTLGGAIANDIHGKNHEKRGTFGCHIRSFTLWRSDQPEVTCSADRNADLFAATIGGMGLTGIILCAEIQLMKVASHHVRETRQAFASLEDYFEQEKEFSSASEYSVAWVDSLARGKYLGRGILMRGDHVEHDARPDYGAPRLSVPLTPPVPLVSGLPLRLFNMAYFHRNKSARPSSVTDPNSFFFPLDAIAGWNRLYGPRGLFQHQSLIPLDAARQIIPNLLSASHQAGQGSFLTVLKRFGGTKSPGFMSFPQPGYTLTLDFANRGTSTRQLLDRLDAITLDAGGRVNPYKDARMSAETFQRGYRLWQNLEKKRDPAIRSDFWQRTTSVIAGSRRQLSAPSLVSPVNQAAKGEIHTQNIQPEQDKPPVRPAATGST